MTRKAVQLPAGPEVMIKQQDALIYDMECLIEAVAHYKTAIMLLNPIIKEAGKSYPQFAAAERHIKQAEESVDKTLTLKMAVREMNS